MVLIHIVSGDIFIVLLENNRCLIAVNYQGLGNFSKVLL